MSSPARRQRSSQSATPRRTSKRNAAAPSSPADPAAAQLQSEAASSQGLAPPPSSSPMKFHSSPADLARANASRERERDVSSPLRQMSNTQTTGDDDGSRTPRASASGLIGGMKLSQLFRDNYKANTLLQIPHPSDMPLQAPTGLYLVDFSRPCPISIATAVPCSYGLLVVMLDRDLH